MTTPTRAELLSRLRTANQRAALLLSAEIALTLLIVFLLVDPTTLAQRLSLTAVALGLSTGGTLVAHLQQLAMKKKRVEGISPTAKLGPYDRQNLRKLVDDTLQKARLTHEAPAVFITRDKEPNAHALRVALLPMAVFDAVFINRAMLHLLDRDELASVIGHELGHARTHGYLWSRFHLVHVALSAASALAVVSNVGSNSVVFALFGVLWLIGWLQSWPGRNLGQVLEFLCDDMGARVAGVPAAVRAELKLGAEAEVRFRLTHFTLERGGDALSPKDALDLYTQALPFGPVDPEGTAKEIERRLAEHTSARRELSVGGFIAHASQQERSEELEAQQKLARVLMQMPRVTLPTLNVLDNAALDALEQQLSRDPHALLFHLPGEVSDAGDTHPSPRRRILYLLRNRREIESARPGAH